MSSEYSDSKDRKSWEKEREEKRRKEKKRMTTEETPQNKITPKHVKPPTPE